MLVVTEAFKVNASTFALSSFFPVSFLRLLEQLSLVFATFLAGLFVVFFLEVLGLGVDFGLTCLTSSALL